MPGEQYSVMIDQYKQLQECVFSCKQPSWGQTKVQPGMHFLYLINKVRASMFNFGL